MIARASQPLSPGPSSRAWRSTLPLFRLTGSVVGSLALEPAAFALGILAILAALGRRIAMAPAVLGLVVAGIALLAIATIAYHVAVCPSLDAAGC